MKTILVAGDVCVDVVGLPEPAPANTSGAVDNWRLTGETRTHHLLGGAMLLADWVDKATPDGTTKPDDEVQVFGPRPCKPAALFGQNSSDELLTPDEFLGIASRLTRDDIVHSLLSLDFFRATPEVKKRDAIRIQRIHGFSGPKEEDPSLQLLPPDESQGPPTFVVLDDTGNRFRRTESQWPAVIQDNDATSNTVVVYKLHRPLPDARAAGAISALVASPAGEDKKSSSLWQTVTRQFPRQRIVIVSIDDLRELDAPISCGLSWERTALDLVWQLLNVEMFAPLRDCPHLIVRFGLDGAVYWHRDLTKEQKYHAWLIYDPTGIEGTADSTCDGQMVGYGSAFTAALVQHLAKADAANCLTPSKDAKGNVTALSSHIEDGTRAGLRASHRLLRLGFGTREVDEPTYPSSKLFTESTKDDPYYACQRIPVIPHSAVPDRGYWRLLDTIFGGKTNLLHRAVALTATKAKAIEPDDKVAEGLLRQVPTAVFAKVLRTHDRREIENYRALYALMLDYIRQPAPKRPLSVAVFGPPGAGKSFGIKQVAKALGDLGGSRPIKSLTFNLSQYQSADQLADAFHLVRDLVLQGNIPLVFFDEFDTSLAGVPLGWLRCFLAPMQDAEFLDRGAPHPIGQSIFVFAGGTCGTYAEFAKPMLGRSEVSDKDAELKATYDQFKSAKGPDFLSRLRGTLDIPGLELHTTFDPFGTVESFPCEAAIILRRAGILAFQLSEKAPDLCDSSGKLCVSPTVLRALLHLPTFVHGNRSLEALLDMSHLLEAKRFTPALFPAEAHAGLHANAGHLSQHLSTEYPFPPGDRETIAQTIHKLYVQHRRTEPDNKADADSQKDWSDLEDSLRESNRKQADDIAVKLRTMGLWFRKKIAGAPPAEVVMTHFETHVEEVARAEHDRWVAEKRSQGWIPARNTSSDSRANDLRLHNCIVRWEELPEELKNRDREPIRDIPTALASAGYDVFKP